MPYQVDILLGMNTTNIRVLLGDTVIGAMQSLTPTINDGSKISFEATRIKLDKCRIAELFTSGRVSHATQFLPFQIVIKENDVEVGRAQNVWLKNGQTNMYTYMVNEWILLDGAYLEAEKVFGVIAGKILDE